MKKWFTGLIALFMILSLTACGTSVSTPTAGHELVMLTSKSDLGDEGERAQKGMKDFAEEYGFSYTTLRSKSDDDAARRALMDDAVAEGAKVVLCPSAAFASAVYQAQTAHHEVMFLLMDDEPHTGDRALYETTVNTSCILYREEQAGYLAGYGLVQNGCRKLGFCGGETRPSVVRYGYGFLQGAEAAARDLSLTAGSVQINYWYADTFAATDDVRDKMAAWYGSGTEVIFACNGEGVKSVIAAAEVAGKKVIGVDLNESVQSTQILTSVRKSIEWSTKQALCALYENGGFWDSSRAGQAVEYGVAEKGIGLDTENWHFQNYTVEAYQVLVTELASGARLVDSHANLAQFPPLTICTVDDQSTYR